MNWEHRTFESGFGGSMPCILRLSAWLVGIGLLVVGLHRWVRSDPPFIFGLFWHDFFVMFGLIPCGAEHAARHRGPRLIFLIYGALVPAVLVWISVDGCTQFFRDYNDRRATTIGEQILFRTALVAGMAVYCHRIGARGSSKEPTKTIDPLDV